MRSPTLYFIISFIIGYWFGAIDALTGFDTVQINVTLFFLIILTLCGMIFEFFKREDEAEE